MVGNLIATDPLGKGKLYYHVGKKVLLYYIILYYLTSKIAENKKKEWQ